MNVELPWPHRDLHPNARVHWAVKAKRVKQAREAAAWMAVAAGIEPISAAALNVTAIFTPPDRRPRDLDGMLSAMKPAFDGLADLLGVDDSKWNIALRRTEPKKPGAVRIKIEVAA
jgi:crossover junction endodeoxyribonuclease RusA